MHILIHKICVCVYGLCLCFCEFSKRQKLTTENICVCEKCQHDLTCQVGVRHHMSAGLASRTPFQSRAGMWRQQNGIHSILITLSHSHETYPRSSAIGQFCCNLATVMPQHRVTHTHTHTVCVVCMRVVCVCVCVCVCVQSACFSLSLSTPCLLGQ